MPVVMQVLKRVVLPVAVLLCGMIALGLVITKVAEHSWPFTVEDTVNRHFAGDRDGFWNGVTWFFSMVGSTPVIIGVTVVAAIVLRWRLHRWREPLYLCAAVTAQAIVFFFATLAIDRSRPQVVHLDQSPPTSSFPSGHTSAAVALYIGLAVVLALHTRPPALKALCWLLILVPVCVALSRLYRGMHHPSDVSASFVNGSLCVLIMASTILDRRVPWGRPAAAPVGYAPSAA
jgi:membrane-associated phospholipid phosphatase